ncbi:MAG: PVC-type heme-binding CxxCH protein [Verrucomicrobiota bacterium]
MRVIKALMLVATGVVLTVVGAAEDSGIGIESEGESVGPAANERVAEIMRKRPGRGTLADGTPPMQAEEALESFMVRDGFEMELVVSEPVVTQPLHLSFDRRGRLWVVQYRQYQFPAGLKVVRYDQHLRAQFDRVPPAPPNHFPGADKVTVLEDTNGDGNFDSHKDVLTGLNIVTSVATGRGGIWVLNPPYLLFYPDRDGDDVPDGDPEVCLSGFGLEDTHAVANSLMWGPDGWLYGANGSTTTGSVSSSVTRGVAWEGQNVWRYHPESKEFEIFAEGGGNTFSLEIDAKGRIFSGTNNGGTRGMYYDQGGYGKKNWGKHGPLTNPYAFGWHEHMEHEGDGRRFAQAFSLYEANVLPESLHGKIIAPNALHNLVWVSALEQDGSGYQTVDEANLLESPDRWFRPVSAKLGPDGAIYLADWYDTRLSHVSPVDDWDKTRGRVYRVRPAEGKLDPLQDLTAMDSARLIGLLGHANREVRRMAVLELGERGDAGVLGRLEEIARSEEDGQRALEGLWALNLLEGLTDELAADLLDHRDEHVRRWVVRLIGDRRYAGEVLQGKLAMMAEKEEAIQVRSQLASSAKRFPPDEAMPIVRGLIGREEDAVDARMPLLVWWTIEVMMESDGGRVMELFEEGNDAWGFKMVREHLLGRVMQRFAMAVGGEKLDACADLIRCAPDADARRRLIRGLEEAFQGRSMPRLPEALAVALEEHRKEVGQSGVILGLRQGSAGAMRHAKELLRDDDADLSERVAVARVLGEVKRPEMVGVLLEVLKRPGQYALKRVVLQSLSAYDDPAIARSILVAYHRQLPREHEVRATADRVLASRLDWAKAYLGEVDAWKIRADEVPPDVVQRLRAHEDDGIDAMVAKHWPLPGVATTAEQVAEMNRVRLAVEEGGGDAKLGNVIFSQRCAVCHRLFDRGGDVGPDLTGYERGHFEFWLNGTIAPSLEIREGYQNYVARLEDGRVVTGVIRAQNGQTVTLKDIANETTILDRGEVLALEASPISLMPEELLSGLSDDELRDLFAYLMRDVEDGGSRRDE